MVYLNSVAALPIYARMPQVRRLECPVILHVHELDVMIEEFERLAPGLASTSAHALHRGDRSRSRCGRTLDRRTEGPDHRHPGPHRSPVARSWATAAISPTRRASGHRRCRHPQLDEGRRSMAARSCRTDPRARTRTDTSSSGSDLATSLKTVSSGPWSPSSDLTTSWSWFASRATRCRPIGPSTCYSYLRGKNRHRWSPWRRWPSEGPSRVSVARADRRSRSGRQGSSRMSSHLPGWRAPSMPLHPRPAGSRSWVEPPTSESWTTTRETIVRTGSCPSCGLPYPPTPVADGYRRRL